VCTRDKEQPLSPDANESFSCEPNITGEGHSSLAKFKESLKSSTRTNHTAKVAQVDLEGEILSLNQSVKELLDEKERTRGLLLQLEERTRRCQREHQDPTLVNEAQKVRPLRAIWARVLSAGVDLQADEEAAAESIKRKGDLGAHPLGLCQDLPLPLAYAGDKKVKRFHFSEIIGGLPYVRATVTVFAKWH